MTTLSLQELTRVADTGLEAFRKLSLLTRLGVSDCLGLSSADVGSLVEIMPELCHLTTVILDAPNSYHDMGGYLDRSLSKIKTISRILSMR